MKPKIIIADDHLAARVGIRSIIESSGAGHVVAEAESAQEILALLLHHPCDVLITDYSMPESAVADGYAMIKTVRRRYPLLPIMVLSASTNPATVRVLRDAGVPGIVDKRACVDELAAAIGAVHCGQHYLSPTLTVERKAVRAEGGSGAVAPLTARELEVLRLVGKGLTTTEIAAMHHRTLSTISRQKGDAMQKLGLRNDSELFEYLRHSKL